MNRLLGSGGGVSVLQELMSGLVMSKCCLHKFERNACLLDCRSVGLLDESHCTNFGHMIEDIIRNRS